MPVCPECKNHLNNIRVLWLHLSLVHKTNKSDKFRCHEEKCFRVFSNWHLFRKHLVFYHKSCISGSLRNSFVNKHDRRSSNDVEIGNREESAESNYLIECSSDISNNINNFILCFLSKVYANHQLPRSFVQELMTDVKQLCTTT